MAESDSSYPEDRPRVLVVDDEKFIRDIIADFLGMEGYIVRTAEDGVSATNEQVVKPIIDQALTAVGATYPKRVRVLPPFFAPSCAVFQTNSPHFADGQAAVVAKVYRDYFLTH